MDKKAKTRKIAILRFRNHYDSYNEINLLIADKLTDFVEVDQETYGILHSAQGKYNFTLVEQPVDQTQFILETVADWKAYLVQMEKEEKERRAKYEREREEAKKKRADKKAAKARNDLEAARAEVERLERLQAGFNG